MVVPGTRWLSGWERGEVWTSREKWLDTDLWWLLRDWRIRMQDGWCADCEAKGQELHHLFYVRDRLGRIWGWERPEHMRWLCKPCHRKGRHRNKHGYVAVPELKVEEFHRLNLVHLAANAVFLDDVCPGW